MQCLDTSMDKHVIPSGCLLQDLPCYQALCLNVCVEHINVDLYLSTAHALAHDAL